MPRHRHVVGAQHCGNRHGVTNATICNAFQHVREMRAAALQHFGALWVRLAGRQIRCEEKHGALICQRIGEIHLQYLLIRPGA